MSVISLVLLMFIASAAVLGLRRNTEFVFPNVAQITNYVKYNPYVPAMDKGIVCGEFQLTHTNSSFISFVSYATHDGGNYANQLLIGLFDGKLSMNVNGDDKVFAKDIDFTTPQKICLTFDSESKKLTLLTASDNERETIDYEGRTLLPGGTLMLGQEQDCKDGCFQSDQAYRGSITNLVMTDFVDESNYTLITYPHSESQEPRIIFHCDTVDIYGDAVLKSYSYIY